MDVQRQNRVFPLSGQIPVFFAGGSQNPPGEGISRRVGFFPEYPAHSTPEPSSSICLTMFAAGSSTQRLNTP